VSFDGNGPDIMFVKRIHVVSQAAIYRTSSEPSTQISDTT